MKAIYIYRGAKQSWPMAYILLKLRGFINSSLKTPNFMKLNFTPNGCAMSKPLKKDMHAPPPNTHRLSRKLLALLVLLISANVYNQAFAQTMLGNQQVLKLNYSPTQTCNALMYVPDDYNSNSGNYPLIIQLHGTGQASTNINQLITDGLPKQIANGFKPQAVNPKDGKTYKFLVFSPQAPEWSFQEIHVAYLLPLIQKLYRIDPSRIYITGYSAGGWGAWTCATDDPGFTSKIAALVPVAPAGLEDSRIPLLRNVAATNLPVWSVCGTADAFWPGTQTYVNDANSYNPSIKAFYTGIPNIGHWSWQYAYDPTWRVNNMNMYEWMLQYTRGNATSQPNQSPVARVSSNSFNITLPTNSVALDGSPSSDPDGSISAYSWSQVSGPAQAGFSAASAAKTNATNLAAGTYVFQLKITDNKGATSTVNVTVTVNAAPNQAPVARVATSSFNITLPTNSVALDGSSSSDPDGSIAGYSWSQISGPAQASFSAAGASKTNASGLAAGTYVFQLKVTDNKSATSTVNVTVTVHASANQSPIARVATNSFNITLPTNSVALDGSPSADPDGSISAYSWSQVSGPAQATFSAASAAKTNASGLTTGSYVFQLKVTDNKGATSTATVNVTVNSATNQAPVARVATTSITLALPTNTVTLDGSSSSDPDGTISSYNWSQVSGPAGTVFSSYTASKISVSKLSAGSYVYQLTVTDNKGATGTAKVTVQVNTAANQAPVAKVANPSIVVTLPANSTTLDGTPSTDADGSVTGYSWSQVSGPANASFSNAATAQTGVSNLVAGTYVFKLTVKDNSNATASTNVTVQVNPAPNKGLAANVSASSTNITLPSNTVTLDGAASTGSIASYSWSQVSGPAGTVFNSYTASKISISKLSVGTYVFQLTVADKSGVTSSAKVTVKVNAATAQAPVAVVPSTNVVVTLPANTVTLDGSGSYDPDGSITGYSWSQVSGPAGTIFSSYTAAKITVSKLSAGTYVYQLTVTDNNGATSTAKITVTVSAGTPDAAPIAAISDPSISLTLPQNSTMLDGSPSSGPIKAYAWSQKSGPASASIANPAAAKASVSNLSAAGTYVFQLTVSGTGGSSNASSTVTVATAAGTPSSPSNPSTPSKPSEPSGTPGGGASTPGNTVCKGKKIYLKKGGDNGIFFDGRLNAYLPGDTLVLKGSPWSYISFNDVYGTASCPVTIINEGGQVLATNGFALQNCRYIKLTGTGSADKYGFHIEDPNGDGVAIDIFGRSSNIEVSNVDIYHKLYGFWVKHEQDCVDSLQGQNWTIDNIKIHDNRIRRMNQEGMYIGSTDPNGTSRGVTCNGVTIHPKPMFVSNVKVYNNIVDSTNRSGIQMSTAQTGNNEIYNNTVSNSGFEFSPQQGNGISLGGYSQAYVHDNSITNTYALGIMVLGAGNIKIDNNTIKNSGYLAGRTASGMDGIMVDTRQTIPVDSSWLTVTNNKISNYTGVGVRFYKTWDTYRKGNIVCNNTGTVSIAAGINWTSNCAAPPPANIAPVAKAGADVKLTLPANSTTLDGSASADADGSIASYSWSKVSGPASITIASPAAAKTAVSNLVAGTYVLALTVTDDKGLTGKDSVTITVSATNVAPVAKAGADVTLTLPVNSTSLDGSASADADGSIASYSWSKVSGPASITIASPAAAKTAVSNLAAGTYVLALTVTDNKGLSSKDSVTITVKAANIAPVAKAGSDVTITLPTNSVALNGSASSDADGTIKAYKWAKVSGPASFAISNATTAATTVSSLVAGTYKIALTVTDDKGATGSDSVVITVKPQAVTSPGGTPGNGTGKPGGNPVARAGNDVTLILPANATTLYGNESSDAYGSIVSYQWRKISGPAQYSQDDSKGYKAIVTNLAEGTYVWELTVTDNNGNSGKDSVAVIVKAANKLPVAVAGSNQIITLPTNSVKLDGAASYDPDGKVVKYEWTKIGGPDKYSFSAAGSAQTTVSGLVDGVYTFQLNVTDDYGATNWATVQVTVNTHINALPFAVINKTDSTVFLPITSIELDGSKSYDIDGTIGAYKWTQVSGPAQATLVTPTQSTTQAADLKVGTYVFALSVADNMGATSGSRISIVVSDPASYNSGLNNLNATLYPNPATSSTINLLLPKGSTVKTSMSIVNNNGQIMQAQTIAAGTITQVINIQLYKPGTYYVVLLTEKGERATLKFIRQ